MSVSNSPAPGVFDEPGAAVMPHGTINISLLPTPSVTVETSVGTLHLEKSIREKFVELILQAVMSGTNPLGRPGIIRELDLNGKPDSGGFDVYNGKTLLVYGVCDGLAPLGVHEDIGIFQDASGICWAVRLEFSKTKFSSTQDELITTVHYAPFVLGDPALIPFDVNPKSRQFRTLVSNFVSPESGGFVVESALETPTWCTVATGRSVFRCFLYKTRPAYASTIWADLVVSGLPNVPLSEEASVKPTIKPLPSLHSLPNETHFTVSGDFRSGEIGLGFETDEAYADDLVCEDSSEELVNDPTVCSYRVRKECSASFLQDRQHGIRGEVRMSVNANSDASCKTRVWWDDNFGGTVVEHTLDFSLSGVIVYRYRFEYDGYFTPWFEDRSPVNMSRSIRRVTALSVGPIVNNDVALGAYYAAAFQHALVPKQLMRSYHLNPDKDPYFYGLSWIDKAGFHTRYAKRNLPGVLHVYALDGGVSGEEGDWENIGIDPSKLTGQIPRTFYKGVEIPGGASAISFEHPITGEFVSTNILSPVVKLPI